MLTRELGKDDYSDDDDDDDDDDNDDDDDDDNEEVEVDLGGKHSYRNGRSDIRGPHAAAIHIQEQVPISVQVRDTHRRLWAALLALSIFSLLFGASVKLHW